MFKAKSYHIIFIVLTNISLLNTALAEESLDAIKAGGKEFQERCALCHGDNARGNGPYAFALVFKPSDLTTLSMENDGVFPFIKTYKVIDGREVVKAHGSRLMPIWGDRYRVESTLDVNAKNNATLVRGKIFELLLYLNSLQEVSIQE